MEDVWEERRDNCSEFGFEEASESEEEPAEPDGASHICENESLEEGWGDSETADSWAEQCESPGVHEGLVGAVGLYREEDPRQLVPKEDWRECCFMWDVR